MNVLDQNDCQCELVPHTANKENYIYEVIQLISSWKERPSWDEYFMATAFLIASRSPCERLHVGCVIVSTGENKNRIITAGYNGFLPGIAHTSYVRDGHEQATVHAEQMQLPMLPEEALVFKAQQFTILISRVSIVQKYSPHQALSSLNTI